MSKRQRFFFPHEANVLNNFSLRSMFRKYGATGYGMWWLLVESLSRAAQYRIDIANDENIEDLSDYMRCDEDAVRTFIHECIHRYKLLHTDGQYIWCPQLTEDMEYWEEKRRILSERGRKGAAKTNAKRWGSKDAANVSDAQATPIIATPEKSREEKNRVDERRVETSTSPTGGEWVCMEDYLKQITAKATVSIATQQNITEQTKQTVDDSRKQTASPPTPMFENLCVATPYTTPTHPPLNTSYLPAAAPRCAAPYPPPPRLGRHKQSLSMYRHQLRKNRTANPYLYAMMSRRKFVKGSAILGASLAVPSMLLGQSGMYSHVRNRKVYRVLNADRTMVGTLPVMRAFAGNHLDYVSPFVLFDEFGPVDITPGTDALRVGAHPHAGVIPTTYFLAGSGHHKDSLNYDFQVQTGEYMMFSSGRGAIHMEESGAKLKEEGGKIHGFQVWLNMSAVNKHDDPTTTVFRNGHMPTIVHKDYTARVVLGELYGERSTVPTFTPTFYYYLKLNPKARLDISVNDKHNAFAYAVSGSVELEGQHALKPNQIALYERGETNINLYSETGAEVFLLGGQPLNEPVYSYGPFVMNTEQQIHQAIRDYQSGRMGDPDVVDQ